MDYYVIRIDEKYYLGKTRVSKGSCYPCTTQKQIEAKHYTTLKRAENALNGLREKIGSKDYTLGIDQIKVNILVK